MLKCQSRGWSCNNSYLWLTLWCGSTGLTNFGTLARLWPNKYKQYGRPRLEDSRALDNIQTHPFENVSDGWRADSSLKYTEIGIFILSISGHDRNFVDPAYDEVWTQSVERKAWRGCECVWKRKLEWQHGTSHDWFPAYQQDFAWQSTFCHENIFL